MATEAAKIDYDHIPMQRLASRTSIGSDSPGLSPAITRTSALPASTWSSDTKPEREERHALAEIPALPGVIEEVGDKFIAVAVTIGGARTIVNVPAELCPREIRLEGLAVNISINPGRFRGLKIEARPRHRGPSPAVATAIDNMLAWADQL